MLVADNQAFAQLNHMNSAAGQQMFQKDGFPHGAAAGVQGPIFPVSNGHPQQQQQHHQHQQLQQQQQQQPLQMQMPQLPMQRFHPAEAQQMYQQQQQQQQQHQQHHVQPVMHQLLQQPAQAFQAPMQPLTTSPFVPSMHHQQPPVMRPLTTSPVPLMLQTNMPAMSSVGGISPTSKPRAPKPLVKKALVAPPPDDDAADDVNEDDIANMPPSKKRPCIHNEWDDVRTRKGSKILRCRMCQRKWKLSSSHVPRCLAFLRSYCPAGDKCQQLHVHKKKSGLKERFEQFGVAVLNAMPPQAKLAAEDAVGMPSRRGSATTSSGSSASGALLAGTQPMPQHGHPAGFDDRKVCVMDHVRRASVATSTSEPPSLLSGQDRRPSLFSETTVGYETRRTSLAISEYDRRASVISENLVIPEGLHHMLPTAHDRRCSTLSELNDSRKQQIRTTLDVIQRMAPADALQNYAFGLSEPELKTPTAQGCDDLAGRRAFAAPGLETNSPTNGEGQRRSSGGSCTSAQNLHCGTSPLHELDATRKSPLYGGPATPFGDTLKSRIHPSGLPTTRSRSSMCSDGPLVVIQPQNVTSPLASSPNSASPKSAASFNKLVPNPENSGVHAMTEDELDAMLTKHEANIIRRKSLDPENMQNQLGATI
ncbi:hypothetical protein DIPPA_02164 [Diplonema papillatum]|nr:hypothetical protein DIPPA_02164 [Diplonema papillatum]